MLKDFIYDLITLDYLIRFFILDHIYQKIK